MNAVLAISKVVENRETDETSGALTVFKALESDLLDEEENQEEDTDSFSLTAHLFSGPEFSEEDPMSPTVGPYEGGSTVKLFGRNFQQGATVYVGDSAAFDVQVLNEGTEVQLTDCRP